MDTQAEAAIDVAIRLAIQVAADEMEEWVNAMKCAGGWLAPDARAVVVAFLDMLVIGHPGLKQQAIAILTAMGA
jgi:hypothetical protein